MKRLLSNFPATVMWLVLVIWITFVIWLVTR